MLPQAAGGNVWQAQAQGRVRNGNSFFCMVLVFILGRVGDLRISTWLGRGYRSVYSEARPPLDHSALRLAKGSSWVCISNRLCLMPCLTPPRAAAARVGPALACDLRRQSQAGAGEPRSRSTMLLRRTARSSTSAGGIWGGGGRRGGGGWVPPPCPCPIPHGRRGGLPSRCARAWEGANHDTGQTVGYRLVHGYWALLHLGPAGRRARKRNRRAVTRLSAAPFPRTRVPRLKLPLELSLSLSLRRSGSVSLSLSSFVLSLSLSLSVSRSPSLSLDRCVRAARGGGVPVCCAFCRCIPMVWCSSMVGGAASVGYPCACAAW